MFKRSTLPETETWKHFSRDFPRGGCKLMPNAAPQLTPPGVREARSSHVSAMTSGQGQLRERSSEEGGVLPFGVMWHSALGPWLCIGILSGELWNILLPRQHPRSIKSKSLGMSPRSQYFFKWSFPVDSSVQPQSRALVTDALPSFSQRQLPIWCPRCAAQDNR